MNRRVMGLLALTVAIAALALPAFAGAQYGGGNYDRLSNQLNSEIRAAEQAQEEQDDKTTWIVVGLVVLFALGGGGFFFYEEG